MPAHLEAAVVALVGDVAREAVRFIGGDFAGDDLILKRGKGSELALVSHFHHEPAAGLDPVGVGDTSDVVRGDVILVKHDVTGAFLQHGFAAAQARGFERADGGIDVAVFDEPPVARRQFARQAADRLAVDEEAVGAVCPAEQEHRGAGALDFVFDEFRLVHAGSAGIGHQQRVAVLQGAHAAELDKLAHPRPSGASFGIRQRLAIFFLVIDVAFVEEAHAVDDVVRVEDGEPLWAAERGARIAAVVPPGGGIDRAGVDYPRPSRRTERVAATLVVNVFPLQVRRRLIDAFQFEIVPIRSFFGRSMGGFKTALQLIRQRLARCEVVQIRRKIGYQRCGWRPRVVAKGARLPAVPWEEVVDPDGFLEAGREKGSLVVAAEPFTGRHAAARAGDSFDSG